MWNPTPDFHNIVQLQCAKRFEDLTETRERRRLEIAARFSARGMLQSSAFGKAVVDMTVRTLAWLYPGVPPACPFSRVRGSVSSSRHFVRSMRIPLTARSCTFRDKIYGTYLVGAAFAIGYSTASDRSLGTTPRPPLAQGPCPPPP